MTDVGFIGLGRMGRPMAGNLQRKGFRVTVFDLNPAPVEHLAALGATRAASVSDVAERCQVIFTCLPSQVEVESVVCGSGGVIEWASADSLVVDLSTVEPEATDRVAAALAAAGLRFVDAPIGRLASHADRGESLFMVGAEARDLEQVRPMLDAMGTTVHHCGAVGTGIRTKLVNNFLAIVSCQMNAEALAMAQRFGLDLERTLDVIHGTSATNGQLAMNFATKVLAGDTEPGFQIDLAHKDLSLALKAANDGRVPVAVGAAAREALSHARGRGWGKRDFSALLDVECEAAGVPPLRFRPGQNLR